MEQQQQYNKELFQFHNGTINTQLFPIPVHSNCCFNSTTVQLIRYIHIVFPLMQVFQFHNGTINTNP